MANLDLFEPERRAELDQYFTPRWIARRAARWIPPGAIVLEPSAGSGVLVRAAAERGHTVVAHEIDERWRPLIIEAGAAELHIGDFLTATPSTLLLSKPECGTCSLQNPPYGSKKLGNAGLDVRFLRRALELADHVIALLKADIEYSDVRSELWTDYARILRRAQLVDRPAFGRNVYGRDEKTQQDQDVVAGGGAERNYVVLEMCSRTTRGPRAVSETVLEERWRETDPESAWTGPLT